MKPTTRRPASAAARWLLAAASLGLSACTFSTADVYRPLVLERFPKEERVQALHREHFGEMAEAEFQESLKLTRKTWDYFDIQVYQSSYAESDFRRLRKAISLAPENPFAWSQLGAYLALQHRPHAAIEATERGLDLLGRLEGSDEVPELRELGTVSRLNLAIYNNSAGRYGDALLALSSIGDLDGLNGFHRLAYYWAAAQAFTGLGELELSADILENGKQVAAQGLGKSRSEFDYPQYFRPKKRAAMFAYLEASNLRALGRYDEAVSKLRTALQPRTGFRELYDARFLLAVTYQEQGELSSARNELQMLAETVPPKLFRLEAIHYQLALVFIDMNELGPAEVELREAVRILRHRNDALQDTLASSPENPAHEILEAARTDDGWVFSPAYNRLAEAYLDRIERRRPRQDGEPGGTVHGSERLIAVKAETLLRTALGEMDLVLSGAARAPLPGVDSYADRSRAERNLRRVHELLGGGGELREGPG